MKKWLMSAMVAAVAIALAGCSAGGKNCADSSGSGCASTGGGTVTPPPVTNPTVTLNLSSTTVTTAQPATVSAKVLDGNGKPVTGVVVTFSANATVGTLTPTTALTDANGVASTVLSSASSTATGADTITATVSVAGTSYSASSGYQVSATTAAITDLQSEAGTTALPAYGQTLLNLTLSGVSSAAPATVNITSSCVSQNPTKATISPATASVSSGAAQFTYKDMGCGAIMSTDTVTVSISGAGVSKSVQVPLTSPAVNNVAYISSTPSQIYLKGSGNIESSTVKFQVVDANGSGLPGKQVTLTLSSYAGGLTLDQHGEADLTGSDPSKYDIQTSDANGFVSGIVNSGTVPTPVRVIATLSPTIHTVSSNLAVVTGLPSQLHFSLSQGTINIEGANYDGVPNTYTIIASDRSGNPVPDGTSIVMWAEGGQVQGSPTTATVNNTSQATANFVSSDPRPNDGRVTVLAYAIGEESFVDASGTNVYTPSPTTNPTNFQDLGDVVKSRLFDGVYDPVNDETVSLSGSGAPAATGACIDNSAAYAQFAIDASIPTKPNTCDGVWSSRTYVRRATETVFSSSSPRALWGQGKPGGSTGVNLDSNCSAYSIFTAPSDYKDATKKTKYLAITGADTYYTFGSTAGSFSIIAADDNPIRLNPMPAGTIITAGSLTSNLGVNVIGGSTVPSTSTPSTAQVSYLFTNGTTAGTISLSFRTPKGVTTSYTFGINTGSPTTACSL